MEFGKPYKVRSLPAKMRVRDLLRSVAKSGSIIEVPFEGRSYRVMNAVYTFSGSKEGMTCHIRHIEKW